MSRPGKEDLLLHELRNRLNLIGFALHAYRRGGDPSQLEMLGEAYEAAVELLRQLDATRRLSGKGEGTGTPTPS